VRCPRNNTGILIIILKYNGKNSYDFYSRAWNFSPVWFEKIKYSSISYREIPLFRCPQLLLQPAKILLKKVLFYLFVSFLNEAKYNFQDFIYCLHVFFIPVEN
jgi:hypothetical protein